MSLLTSVADTFVLVSLLTSVADTFVLASLLTFVAEAPWIMSSVFHTQLSLSFTVDLLSGDEGLAALPWQQHRSGTEPGHRDSGCGG